jgi:hypothetical protein
MKSKIESVVKSFKLVFRRPSYIVLGVLTAFFFLLLAIWLPNLRFLREILSSEIFSFSTRMEILLGSFGFLGTNFTAVTRWLTIAIVTLTGINVAMLVFYLRRRIGLENAAGTGILGTIAGLVGIGCASCGSVVLSSIFGLSATASFIGVLPLQGLEFGIFGIVILVFSIFLVTQKIQNPAKCRI